MRLIFLLLALVAAATAIPKLKINAGNVDALKIQKDILSLLRQVFQDIPDEELREYGRDFDVKELIHNFNDPGVVKYLVTAYKLGLFQRKGVPFTVSISKLRKEVAVLTRCFLAAKDYKTFLKIACWTRRHFNEAQFVKAFTTAILQRHDTKDVVVLPAMYEVFPYYFFDARVIRKAQDLRVKCMAKGITKKVMEIPVDWTTTSWLPKGEDKLTYFTHDIGLNNYMYFFNMGGWIIPEITHTGDDTTIHNVECDRCEIGRGAQYLYTSQQLYARYNMERLSNNLKPVEDVNWEYLRTPFKPHLIYPNGLEFPGRLYDINLMPEKKELIDTIRLLEKRLRDAIDSGFVISTQGSLLALYDRKGVDLLGNLIESTGRSINPKYYGSYQFVARELLGGAPYTRDFFDPLPSVLEIPGTMARDPMFYKLMKKITFMWKRFTDSLPMYKESDLIAEGVTIENVKFDKLITYCDKFTADIDAATYMFCDKEKEEVEIKAVMDRLNHKPFNFEINVNSEKQIKKAVVRVFIGPKYDFEGRYVDIKDHRHLFVELDQFFWDIKEGRTTIVRKSVDAPMRSFDFETKKTLFRKIEDGLNSHQPFYPYKIPQLLGFPERLALPKGKRNGLPLQVIVIVSSPKMKTVTYTPVVPEKFQLYRHMDFDELVGDYMKLSWNKLHSTVHVDRKDMDDTYKMDRKTLDDTFRMDRSDERVDHDYIRDRTSMRYPRTIDDRRVGVDKDRDYDRDLTRDRTMDRRTDRFDLDEHDVTRGVTYEGKVDYMTDYYKDKKIYEVIGGGVSLDGRSLGYPFDRPLTDGCLWVPNIKVLDVEIYYDGKDCMF